jgi:hypothetical protein
MDEAIKRNPSQEEIDEESRRMRRLRIIVHLALDTIAGGGLSPESHSSSFQERNGRSIFFSARSFSE